ncbi:hypothetical protein Ancab_029704 [Ancistrocladus abbreviatus]
MISLKANLCTPDGLLGAIVSFKAVLKRGQSAHFASATSDTSMNQGSCVPGPEVSLLKASVMADVSFDNLITVRNNCQEHLDACTVETTNSKSEEQYPLWIVSNLLCNFTPFGSRPKYEFPTFVQPWTNHYRDCFQNTDISSSLYGLQYLVS